ncbi:hypothetical protein BJX63DRAFT_403132 [Aspergillus granulosus]|uniref:CFEM domain-containing protein n=1 Tax=Aspergillus granulosus TaxID=176169 RepID=A0ABR4H3P9_9EURO
MKSPSLPLYSISLLHIALEVFLHTSLGLATTATIADSAPYQSQRPCALRCYGYDSSDSSYIASNIDCDTDPVVENECLCRSDLQSDAVAYLRECVSSSCEKDYDVSLAVSLYTDYCTSAGYTAETTTTPTPSLGTPDPPPTVTVTVLETVVLGAAPRLSAPLLGRIVVALHRRFI